ncbi:hypothetical protein AX15_000846 [Amanita polypyramis BW_CC]|nr:hypothetical protein AX15_000846 [Amanita polypyramis BW_CC]
MLRLLSSPPRRIRVNSCIPLTRITYYSTSMPTTRSSVRRLAAKGVVKEEEEARSDSERLKATNTGKSKTTRKPITTAHVEDEIKADSRPNPPRKRKAKVLEEDNAEHLERWKACPWKIGAHVSSAGGVENAVLNASAIGANAFALFLKSQRKWNGPPLSEESISLFKSRLKELDYTTKVILPHGSYLINLGNPDAAKREKSYECFIDDLKRCEQLGLELYNFHPGSTVGATSTEESIGHIAECINRAHKELKFVTVVIENMAGSGNVIGSDFAELGGIIDLVEDKSRVGICLDTCHMFAAGYDIRTKEGWDAMLSEFDEKIGLNYLRGMHLNDSKLDLGSRRDRHENIGLGFLGIGAFAHVLSDPRVQGMPLILETQSFEKPRDVWGKEIQVLHQLAGIEKDNQYGLTETEEKEMTDSVREVVEKVGGSKKSRTSKVSVKGKAGRPKKSTEEYDSDHQSSEDG